MSNRLLWQRRPRVPTFPVWDEPEVSVIVPVHDRWGLTADCLSSITANLPSVTFEVIVVDDASEDETARRLSEINGIRVVRLFSNVGFLGAVNAGLDVARGEFVVLLNNDTLVQPGWLDALARTARTIPEVAVVGAKLVYPDGRLQEAGAIIWNEASGYLYGYLQDPDDPMYNFVRDVDYCSGACLLIRRQFLSERGGLDPRFSPAYYEDTDLSFAARAAGYRVLYQPEAVVCHIEGGSHGRNVDSGIKHYQAVNKEKFREKWADVLKTHPDPTPAVRIASWRPPGGRVLVVDHKVPRPDHDSGSRRMFEMLTLLTSLGFGVTFVPQDGELSMPYTGALQGRGVEVLRGPDEMPRFLDDVGSALRLAILCRPTIAWSHYPLLRSLAPASKLVYDTVDLHFVREHRRAEIGGTAEAHQSAKYHHEIELTLARLYDATWVVSDAEADLLKAEDPSLTPFVVPNIHPRQDLGPGFSGREGLLFVGSVPHPANRDAMLRLVDETLPLVHKEIPEVKLLLVGSEPTEEIRALSRDRVEVLGWVQDLNDLYRRCRLFVAPLRFGAGMKGKIGESLSYGLPVVTTSVGAEGMHLVNGEDVLIADEPERFAAAICRAYTDSLLWTRLSAGGRGTIEARYSPEASRRNLVRVLDLLAVGVSNR